MISIVSQRGQGGEILSLGGGDRLSYTISWLWHSIWKWEHPRRTYWTQMQRWMQIQIWKSGNDWMVAVKYNHTALYKLGSQMTKRLLCFLTSYLVEERKKKRKKWNIKGKKRNGRITGIIDCR